jgi:hypothetical protein
MKRGLKVGLIVGGVILFLVVLHFLGAFYEIYEEDRPSRVIAKVNDVKVYGFFYPEYYGEEGYFLAYASIANEEFLTSEVLAQEAKERGFEYETSTIAREFRNCILIGRGISQCKKDKHQLKNWFLVQEFLRKDSSYENSRESYKEIEKTYSIEFF